MKLPTPKLTMILSLTLGLVSIACQQHEAELESEQQSHEVHVASSELKSFLEYCKDDNVSDAIKHTVKVMKRVVNKDDCESAFSELEKLTRLSLKYNDITDVSPLAGLSNLTDLDLTNDKFPDMEAFVGLSIHNGITDVSPLAGLSNLTVLKLYDNSITDVSPLAGLSNLTVLTLSNNSITDVSPLGGLSNLTVLTLSNNSITDVSPLAGLSNLTVLSLSNNRITDVSPLGGLSKLTRLSLKYNDITDVSPLVGLSKLTKLDLGGNNITYNDLACPITRGPQVLRDRCLSLYP